MDQTRPKIILVDDNLATLNQGKALLNAFYKVYTVQSAATLFENLEHDIPDLILLDVEMPEMDGFETIKKLKADVRYKDIPVIFLTARSDEESEREGFSLGAVDYIAKPFSGPLLQKRISNQLLYIRVQSAIKDYADDMEIMMDEIDKANERTRVLLDKTPLCARLWDRNRNLIDCNEAALRLFNFNDKQEFSDRYSELYPEYQPDGQRSYEKVAKLINKAFEEGSCTFDWTYKMLDGTPMPAEVILVRVEYEDDYAVAGYTRDLRKHNKMMKDIEYRGSLLQAVNRAAAILLDSDIDSFENALYNAMKVLAETVIVDRVRIFKNHTANGELFCTQLYEWSESVERMLGKEATINVSFNRQIPGWEEKFARGHCVNSLVRDMSREEQAHLTPQGILSLLVVPVHVEDRVWGHIGFDDCSRERIFTEEEESILLSCSLLFTNALLRNEMVVNIRDNAIQLKAAAEKALEDEERMQLMLDAMPLACRLINRDYKITDCNQEAISLFGTADKEEYIANIIDLSPAFQPNGRRSDDLGNEYVNKAFEEGYQRFEWLHEKPDGELLPCEVTLVHVRHKGEEIIAKYARDLREQKAVIEEMRKAEIAEESNKAKSRFLATMSHEIRTPINSILGFAELALDNDIEPGVRDYLNKITNSTKWLLHIINDILDISKIESGKMEFKHEPFDLYDVFLRCQSVILPKTKEKGISLNFYMEPLEGKKLLGDPTRLFQAIINLLYNAAKFTNDGTIKLSSMVKSSKDDTTTIYFEVKDSGIGMNPEQIERIFESFIQADSSTTRSYDGMGLGLAITKNIIELMGGRLAVVSLLGAGSIFSFEIVFHTVDVTDSTDWTKESDSAEEKPRFDGLVLICDDNLMNQEVIREHLARVGLQTMVAENGKIGVEMVQERLQKNEKPFDLIFMDIFMPVMDGMEAALKITELCTGTPIVAMTANMMIGEQEKYIESGMRECLGKPFTSKELWRCLMKFLKPISRQAANDFPHTQTKNDLRHKLINYFVKDNRTRFSEIKKSIEAGDIKRAHRMAHTLKNNAAQVGKTILQQAAADVEYQLKDGHNLVTPQQMIILEKELNAVLAELEPMLAKHEPKSAIQTEPINAESALELIEILEPMLEMGNPDCLNLIASLRAIPGNEGLIQQMEDLDFEPAILTLAELKEKLETT